MQLPEDLNELVTYARMWSKLDIWDKAKLPPPKSGAYCWWFKELPPLVPTESCLTRHGFTLLYLGFSPQKPSKNAKPSERHIRQRIRYHFRGNASGSTLRLTLGCLLGERLGISLQKSGKKVHFGEGETTLSEWLSANGRVSWVESDKPWILEKQALKALSLPLNLPRNEHHEFHSTLTKVRTSALETLA